MTSGIFAFAQPRLWKICTYPMPESPIAAAELSDLIGLIYDCAIDPEAWTIALPAVRASLNCCNAQLILNELPSARAVLDISDGISDYWRARQDTQYMADGFAFWASVLSNPALMLDEPVVALRDAGPEAFRACRLYAEWGHPQGIHDLAGLILMRDATRMASIGFARHDTTGPVGEREIGILRLLAPHLRRAVTISNMLDTATIAAKSFESALDTLNTGIILVDATARIVHANSASQQMLKDGGAIRSVGGRLQTALPAATAALSAAIAQAGRDAAGMGRSGIGVPVSDANGRRHLAHVLPLQQRAVRGRLASAAVAAVFIAPSHAGPPIPAAALGALYDLTPAEARVLVDISAGHTPAALASALGVAEATVRTHLARVFSKTGTSRQADLVRLVGSLNLPIGQAT